MKTIGVYSYVLWGELYRLPYKEMIHSVVPVADEIVIVTDLRMQDGTLEALKDIRQNVPCLRIYPIKINFDNPNVDGATKAYARSLCSSDYLIQMDADEVLRVEDYPKIRNLIHNWNPSTKIVSTSVVNWFGGEYLKMSSAGWVKERISINSPDITHGIPLRSRIPYGIYFRAKPDTDGAGYIHSKTGMSLCADERYVGNILDSSEYLYSEGAMFVHHYGWYDVARKWRMKPTWHYMWGALYGRYRSLDDYTEDLDGEAVDFWRPGRYWRDVDKSAIRREMLESSIIPCPKHVTHPAVMKRWIANSYKFEPDFAYRVRKAMRRLIRWNI